MTIHSIASQTGFGGYIMAYTYLLDGHVTDNVLYRCVLIAIESSLCILMKLTCATVGIDPSVRP